MAQTNFTPISLYYSTTASAVPTAANLVPGELAINTNDGKLYYEDSSGVVQVLATKGGVGTSSTTQILYNSSGLVAGSSNLIWDSSGRLLAGTSTSAYGGHELMYNPGASAWSSAVINTKTDNSTVTNGFLVKYTGVSPADGNYMFLCQDSGNTNRFYVTNAGATGGTSDRNLKKNIETTRDGYAEDLCKIRIVKYNWKEQPEGTPKDLGWIAQEVEEVFPRMIKTDEDTGIKSVTYSAFVPMLIKAIQEQQALIESLTTRLTALENK